MLHGDLLGVGLNERLLGMTDDGFFPKESKDGAYFTLLNGAEKPPPLAAGTLTTISPTLKYFLNLFEKRLAAALSSL